MNEWLRVIRKNGLVVLIVPHKERTFDKFRPITPVSELMDRHNGKLEIKNYKILQENSGFVTDGNVFFAENYQTILKNGGGMTQDDHHHWSVWDLESFLELCAAAGFKVIDSLDTDDKVGNGFIVVIKK